MRWFTCTLLDFEGGDVFFSRDSGLWCRGFQAKGVECHAVMPGPERQDDNADLIRTEFSNLESSEWWKNHGLDGVVLYSWGSPRYRRVARAIREAGIFLVLNQDSGGLVSPLAGPLGWMKEQRTISGGGVPFLKAIARGLLGIAVTDPFRAIHLKAGHVIACVSPAAVGHYRRLCGIYGGKKLAARVELLPHPVETVFKADASPAKRSRQVACVGRWHDHLQKRPGLLQEVIGRLLLDDNEVTVEIAGATTPALERWHASLPSIAACRVHLRGRVNHAELARIFAESRVFYSPSAYESFGIAAAEALCCGCSVVAGRSLSMESFEWFVSGQSGQLADRDDADGHVRALQRELAEWDAGKRDAGRIATKWGEELHADKLAARTLELRTRAMIR